VDTIGYMNPVLLLAFRRWWNLDEILDSCRTAGVNRIYVHVDAGKTPQETEDVDKTLEKLIAFRNRWGLIIRIANQKKNVGCSIAMISSINEIFQFEDNIIVLEDDCIPTTDFFGFMDESFREMKKNSEIALACGAQFAPGEITHGRWALSRYPLNWGWGITKSQWVRISNKITSGEKLKYTKNSHTSRVETTYWNAGCRRAMQGYTDVWDTLLVREMLRLGSYSILPSENLVLNVGNDASALHTHREESRINFPTGRFRPDNSIPLKNLKLDSWIQKKIFRISRRHYISTKITKIRDCLFSRPKFQPLPERIQTSSVNFDL
jgi:hypothetical protein